MNFYCQFIEDFLRKFELLNSLLKEDRMSKFKNLFTLMNEIRKIFQDIKKVFIKVFILVYYDSKLLIKIKTDASITVVMKILLQQSAVNLLTD